MDIAAPMKSSCDLQPDDAQMRETPKTQQNFLEAAMPALSHGGAPAGEAVKRRARYPWSPGWLLHQSCSVRSNVRC